MRATTTTRFIAALALLALAGGTVLAASPSPSAGEAASASPSADLVSAEPSVSPEASEASPTHEASEAAEASEAPDKSEAPDASDGPEAAETEGNDGPPTAAEAADIVARLKAAGITTTDAAFLALAAQVGTGGAVRTLAFAQASGKTPAQIVAMFEGGMGWGQIDHQLGLSIGPGIGWIMGHGHGNGNGNGNGKGHDKANGNGQSARPTDAPGVTK